MNSLPFPLVDTIFVENGKTEQVISYEKGTSLLVVLEQNLLHLSQSHPAHQNPKTLLKTCSFLDVAGAHGLGLELLRSVTTDNIGAYPYVVVADEVFASNPLVNSAFFRTVHDAVKLFEKKNDVNQLNALRLEVVRLSWQLCSSKERNKEMIAFLVKAVDDALFMVNYRNMNQGNVPRTTGHQQARHSIRV